MTKETKNQNILITEIGRNYISPLL